MHIEALAPEIATETPPLERATDAQFWSIAAKSFVAGAPSVPLMPLAPGGPAGPGGPRLPFFAVWAVESCFATSLLTSDFSDGPPSAGDTTASAATSANPAK